MTIDATTLCICRHIHSMHNQDADCMLCRCGKFQASSRRSSSHYQRGTATVPKRVARVEIGDVILIGFPGYMDYERGPDGLPIWEQSLGEVTSYPRLRHVQDNVPRIAERKTGALLARVTGHDVRPGPAVGNWRRSSPSLHVLHTDLGDLAPVFGVNVVMVVADASSR